MCGGAATSHASQSGFAPVRGADIIAVTFVSALASSGHRERKATGAPVLPPSRKRATKSSGAAAACGKRAAAACPSNASALMGASDRATSRVAWLFRPREEIRP
jgi:hypothetical protein